MLRSRKNIGKYHMACYYGCCRNMPKHMEKRAIKRKEKREWKNDY